MKRKAFLVLAACALWVVPAGVWALPEDVTQTKHNLSVTGPGTIRATTEQEVCVFCHTPHNASPKVPLWNHAPSAAASYTLYDSLTLDAAVGQPDGASKLCLGCHDGTVAVGLTGSRGEIEMIGTGGGGIIPPGPSNLTTDLSDDHPISFTPDPVRDPETRLPPSGDPVHLDENGKVQCTSCHNPHTIANPMFLVEDSSRGKLCVTCHVKTGWVGSAHEASADFYPTDQAVSTVADVSCNGCHTSHAAPGARRLLRAISEDEACYECHQPAPIGVGPDIRTQSLKISRHPFDAMATDHEPVNTVNPAEPVLLDRKHVVCSDCHNPHRATPEKPLEGVRGIGIDGSVVQNNLGSTVEEYQVCLRCHGETFDRFIPPAPVRPPGGSDKSREFSPGSGSFHPVAEMGRNQSIRLNTQLARASSGLTTISRIKCSDCHNNDFTSDAQGPASNSQSGPKGPHGSANERLLRASYSTAVGTLSSAPFATFNESNFALCFLCHDVRSFTSQTDFTGTNFGPDAKDGQKNLHALHLAGNDHASCHECHYNVHGTAETSTTDPPNAPHLISFSPNVQPVPPNPLPIWRPAGGANGGAYCLLSCHGEEMKPDMDYLP